MPYRDKAVVRQESLALMVMIDASYIVQRSVEKRMLRLKLGFAQQRILALVYFASESLNPSMLAALLLQEVHSVSGLLSRLENRGLVTRARDKTDRRMVWIGLTEKGSKLAEEAIDLLLAFASDMKPLIDSTSRPDAVGAIGDVRDIGMAIARVDMTARREGLRRVWG